RRRHTRWPRDWSSDVCSSDLAATNFRNVSSLICSAGGNWPGDTSDSSSATVVTKVSSSARAAWRTSAFGLAAKAASAARADLSRSEERRVGKEWRCWGLEGQL